MPLSDAELLAALRAVLERHGRDIGQNHYDRLLDSGKPGRKTIIRRFGTWEEGVKRAFEGVEASAPEEPEEPEENAASRSYLIVQNEKLMAALDKQRNLNQVFIENCLAAVAKLHVRALPVPPMEHICPEQEFHALRSDAQVGQKTDATWVQGVSHYDADTYAERVQRWTEKVVTFREQDKGSLGLNKLVLHHLGDQVEGEAIYKGQPFYLDLHLTDQLFYSVEVESNAVLTLAQHFPEVEIFCVLGNHGRPGEKGANSQKANFDYLFYRSLKAALSHQPNIKVYVSESPSMIVQHGRFVFLLNHGDSARGWNGIPFYGLERMFRRMHDLHGMIINYELCGHHHQPANLSDRIIMNGCLPGGSDLSINRMGVSNLPSQKIFYFDPSHGLNRESNLYLDEPRKLESDERGVFTKWV